MYVCSLNGASEAQTFTVLHQFSGGDDGGRPGAGIAFDRAGNIYGTTEYGGDWSCNLADPPGCGVVFRLKKTGSGWVLSPIHTFEYADGDYLPFPGTPAIGPNGSLYAVTARSGRVFNSVPGVAAPSSVISPWAYKTLHLFFGQDGADPNRLVPLLFDLAGNIYGTTIYGGPANAGVIYEMTPSTGGWTESVLYSFAGGSDGADPNGITFDDAGNIYGVAAYGGNQDCDLHYGCGLIYKLTPSQSGWTKATLHVFQQGIDGGQPGPLIRDKAGNLYGLTEYYGPDNGGTVWELSPSSGGGWTFTLLHSFQYSTAEDLGPYALTMDAAGNLYGISVSSSSDNDYCGFLFKLTPSNGSWVYTELYDFGTLPGQLDGCWPHGAPVLDADGNIYGSTEIRGRANVGTVWEFTP